MATPTSERTTSRRSAARGWTVALPSHHQIDQPVGDEDDPLHAATVKMPAHVPVSQRRGARLVFGEAARQDETSSRLAVDLDDELDGVGRRPSGIMLRPVLAFEEAASVAKLLPQ